MRGSAEFYAWLRRISSVAPPSFVRRPAEFYASPRRVLCVAPPSFVRRSAEFCASLHRILRTTQTLTRLSPEVFFRVLGLAVNVYLEVQVGTGGQSRLADLADGLPP